MARRTFFSFHYTPDVWRAWNVRNSWVMREDEEGDAGFFDSSVFEASKRESDDSLRRFLREGLKNTSVTCVLAGTNTWRRRWVRYEIVQSVLKGNGLLTVDIDGVRNKDGEVCAKGADPLAQIGLYRVESGIFFAEWNGEKWVRYEDYGLAIKESALWFAAPTTSSVMQLSNHCLRYDFAEQNGRGNIGGWVQTAAELAGWE